MPDGSGGPAKRVEWRRSDGSDQSYDGYYRGRRIAHLSRHGDATGRDVSRRVAARGRPVADLAGAAPRLVRARPTGPRRNGAPRLATR